MTSLTEVSRAAGVSISTASRVLNGSHHPVSPELRERVLAAAEQVGYSRNALARGLVSRSSRLIGVIVSDITNPYFAAIARGVDDVASRAGYVTMLSNADRRTGAEITRLQAMREYHAAGVIFAGSGYPDDPQNEALAKAVHHAQEHGVHAVCLTPRPIGASTITIDNQMAAYDLTDYLISLGHRRIDFVDGPAGLTASEDRRAGYLTCMSDADLGSQAEHHEGGFDFESGHAAAARILARRDLPDAIIAANDEAAVGVLDALRGAGIDVPGQVCVAGIDDLPVARFARLTTVSLPLYELGAMAANQIIDTASGTLPTAAQTTTLPHRLIPRATTIRRARRRGYPI